MKNLWFYCSLRIFHPKFYKYKELSKTNELKKKHSTFWVDCYKWLKLNKKLNKNLKCGFPVSPLNTVINYKNVSFDFDDIFKLFQGSGKYYQGIGKIIIGKGTWIADNVAIITSNHDFNDLNRHSQPEDVVIGDNCWIGINSVILPGVKLGNHVIVGAGSIVTKSFLENDIIICGNPARIVRKI